MMGLLPNLVLCDFSAISPLLVAPHLTVVNDVMSDVTLKARRIFNKLQAQYPQ